MRLRRVGGMAAVVGSALVLAACGSPAAGQKTEGGLTASVQVVSGQAPGRVAVTVTNNSAESRSVEVRNYTKYDDNGGGLWLSEDSAPLLQAINATTGGQAIAPSAITETLPAHSSRTVRFYDPTAGQLVSASDFTDEAGTVDVVVNAAAGSGEVLTVGWAW